MGVENCIKIVHFLTPVIYRGLNLSSSACIPKYDITLGGDAQQARSLKEKKTVHEQNMTPFTIIVWPTKISFSMSFERWKTRQLSILVAIYSKRQ